jgi:hypothetical protein
MGFKNIATTYKKMISTKGLTIREELINSFNDNLLESFEDDPSFYTIQHKNRTTSVLSDIGVRLSTPYSIKASDTKIKDDYFQIIFKNFDATYGLGDIFVFDNYSWMVVDTSNIKTMTNSVLVQKCNNTLNFYDSSDVLHEIPCIVLDKYSVSIENTKYMPIVNCDILVIVSNTTTNRLITPNYIFKIGTYNYEVSKPDDITKPNLLLLPMNFTETEQIIPVVEEASESGTDYILSGDSEIKVGSTKVYTAQKYINGVLTVANFTFSIVNTGVPISAYTLTVVDGDSCSIKCNTAGYAIQLRAYESGVNTDKNIKLKSRI